MQLLFMQHPKMWIHEDKLSKMLMKNLCFAVKYIQNMSLLKELHQLNVMDNTLLYRTQRHVFQIKLHCNTKVKLWPSLYRPVEVNIHLIL